VRRALAAAAVAALALLAHAPGAAAAATLAPPVTIAGPSSDVVALGNVALAQDGGGAVAYVASVAGVDHVFVSVETAGAWGAPVQLDTDSAVPASAPVVAVADDGRVAAAWIAGGELYGAVEAAGTAAFSAPQAIAPASGQPALGMGVSGTAYVAYVGGAGDEIDAAWLYRTATTFTVLAGSLSATPIALAPGGGPTITVAADATGVVAWTQQAAGGATAVYERRVSAAGPSPVLNDLTLASLDGEAGGSADSPTLGVAWNSSDAWAAFRETIGGVSRVVVEEILGDEPAAPVFADSLPSAAGAASALAPSLAVNGNDQAILACGVLPSNALSLAAMGTDGAKAWSAGAVVGAASNAAAPAPVAALSATGSGLVAYTPAAGELDAELVSPHGVSGPVALSDSTLGPVDRAAGLAASADDYGDVAVAYVAGAAGALSLVVQPYVVAPGAPRATGTQLWTAVDRPVLRWQPSSEHWAPPTYTVYLDGAKVATTTQTSYAPPGPLADGHHTWRVVASDAFGQTASSQTRQLLIDVAPPTVALRVSGRRRAGRTLAFIVSAGALSGVHAVAIDYGDGHAGAGLRTTHAYRRAGTYAVRVVVTDAAGVSATLDQRVTIA